MIDRQHSAFDTSCTYAAQVSQWNKYLQSKIIMFTPWKLSTGGTIITYII